MVSLSLKCSSSPNYFLFRLGSPHRTTLHCTACYLAASLSGLSFQARAGLPKPRKAILRQVPRQPPVNFPASTPAPNPDTAPESTPTPVPTPIPNQHSLSQEVAADLSREEEVMIAAIREEEEAYADICLLFEGPESEKI